MTELEQIESILLEAQSLGIRNEVVTKSHELESDTVSKVQATEQALNYYIFKNSTSKSSDEPILC